MIIFVDKMESQNVKRGYQIQWLIGVGDLLLLNLLFFLIYLFLDEYYVSAITNSLRQVILLLNFSYFIALYFVPIQIHKSIFFIEKVVQRSFTLITTLFFLFVTCLMFLNVANDLATFIVIFFVASLLIFSFWRVFVRMILKWYRSRGYNQKNVIIVGAGKNGMELYKVMKEDLSYGFNILGFFDDNFALKDVLPNYLGYTHELYDYVDKNDVDEIYCALPGSKGEQISMMLNFSEKKMIRFYIIPDFYRNVKRSMVLDILETIPVLSIRKEPLQSVYNRAFKRAFDIVFSFLVLIAVFPILLLILYPVIKLTSKGPLFFKQRRTGIYGHEFDCYKFRTMTVNKEADTKQAQKGDARITSVGHFLRKSNLDEFPQFINVFLGDMSVVGPRPHMLKHTEQYSALIDKYMVRHLVKPGVTGWAQVTGYRGETRTLEQMEGRVKRDVWYIENWSFYLDLKIIVVTFLQMLKGDKNAY